MVRKGRSFYATLCQEVFFGGPGSEGEGRGGVLKTVEFRKGIAVRFLHGVNCDQYNNVHEVSYAIVS